jgi:hypothetical protein
LPAHRRARPGHLEKLREWLIMNVKVFVSNEPLKMKYSSD